MTPYLAIIKDSFREAFASRVMPFLLVMFTLVLLVLAPLGLREESASELKFDDVIDARTLVVRMKEAADSDAASPGRHIWNRMPAATKDDLSPDEGDNGKRVRLSGKLRTELVRQLKEPGFFDAAAWKDVELSEEGRKLADTPASQLNESQIARRNRLALEAAFPAYIAPTPKTSVELTYFGGEFFLGNFLSQLSVEREDVQKMVQGLLAGFCTYFLGKFGVFIAILVSAAIIPRMYEAGSIDLLLSKPVSRTMLFLTKFFSGCAFILINVAYFMFGLWLIVGLRFGIWSGKLLLTIPVFLFVFAIVYSFSALAGVLWRNAIVSVMVAVMAWLFCMGLGIVRGAMDGLWNSDSIATIVPAGDGLLATTKAGTTSRWDEKTGSWQEVFSGAAAIPARGSMGFFSPLIGPVYDGTHGQIVAVQVMPSPMGLQGGGNVGRVVIGRREQEWSATNGIQAPSGTSRLFIDRKGRLLAAGNQGVYRCDGDLTDSHRPFKVFGLDIADKPKVAQFVRVGPADSSIWFSPFSIGHNPVDDSLIVFDRGRLRTYELNGKDEYERKADRTIDTKLPAVVACGASAALFALEDGSIQILDRATLETKETVTPFGKSEPRSIAVSPDGRWFAVLFHQKNVWLYDAQSGKGSDRGIAGQGDITAATFSTDGKLLVAHRTTRVSRYTVDTLSRESELVPPANWPERIYRYIVIPLHTVLPKPGDLDYLIGYLFTDQKSEASPGSEGNLQTERNVVDVWTPVWSNLIFLSVILGLTSWYISRKDF